MNKLLTLIIALFILLPLSAYGFGSDVIGSEVPAIPWEGIFNYPSPCSPGFAITALNDTITCTRFILGTGDSVTGDYNFGNDGSLNVSENITVEDDVQIASNLRVGLFNEATPQLFSEQGDVWIGGRLFTNRSTLIRASPQGFGLFVQRSDAGDFIFASVLDTLNSTTGVLCDDTDPFNSGNRNDIISVPGVGTELGIVGEIDLVLNSTCVVLSLAALGSNTVDDFSDRLYFVVDTPILTTFDGGSLLVNVHPNEDSHFEVVSTNKTGGIFVIFEDNEIATDSHSSLIIDSDTNGRQGVTGIQNLMFSRNNSEEKTVKNLLLEVDGTNMLNNRIEFFELDIVGAINETNELIGMVVDPRLDSIIEAGSLQSISAAWYDDTVTLENLTENLTDSDIDNPVFEVVNSIMYIGNTENFTTVSFSLTTGSSKSIDPLFYYCNSSNEYELFTPTDSTIGFQMSGSLTFTNPANRGKCNTEIDGTPLPDVENYTYVAIERTRSQPQTTPVVSSAAISGAVESFFLHKDILRLQPTSAPPEACDANSAGAIYNDVELELPCYCKASSWVQMDDFITVCS